MKDNNYEFHVGDEVETIDGMVGKIVGICHCEKCAERGFFEPKWETPDGKYSDYITVYQKNCCFPDYRRIGKYVWDHETDEEKINENILQKENRKMKEIKLTIDGKEVKLTDEQLRLLGIEKEEKRKNPFKRVGKAGTYFSTSTSYAEPLCDLNDEIDDELFEGGDYFNDEAFAKQVALHQLLYRKLLKFAYDNECEDAAEWSRKNQHYSIRYSYENGDFVMFCQYDDKGQDVYFSSESDAERAINEVIKPFMEEHPDFVW